MTKSKINKLVNRSEVFFAGLVLVFVAFFTLRSVFVLFGLDWSEIEAFYELINRVLILVVGLELAKLLITHDIYAISDLLTFVVARKVLKPDLTSVDILLSILAFAVLFMLNQFFKRKKPTY